MSCPECSKEMSAFIAEHDPVAGNTVGHHCNNPDCPGKTKVSSHQYKEENDPLANGV